MPPQIQFAKLEASESLASLGAGRKLLHKHKHDKEQADNKEEKEDLKDHDKYRHHAVQEEQHDYTDTMNPREKVSLSEYLIIADAQHRMHGFE